MCLSRSRNSYSVAVGKSEGLYCTLGCSMQAGLRASGSPMGMPRGTPGPPWEFFLPLVYRGKNLKWTGELCELQLFDAVLWCGGLFEVGPFVKAGLELLFVQPWVTCLLERPTESSVSCSGGHGAARATCLWACSNIPVASASRWGLCKPNTSFAAGLWPTYRLRPELPCRAVLAWWWFFSEWGSSPGEPRITYTPSARP